MAKRSLQASLTGIQQAKRAFALKGWTQENLAGEVNLKTRQPIWRFFTGRTVDRYIFIEVCSVLELNWREIAIAPPAEFSDSGAIAAEPRLDDIDVLVQYVRSQRQDKIQDQCGTLQLLDTSRLVDIDDIYIDVNVLEEIDSDRWLEIADLQSPTAQEFDRLGLDKAQNQISSTQAAETYSKLRVLGKPGAGKTAFLQHLAIQCDRKEFAANRVPIFISLRDFADESQATGNFSLLNYIHAELLAAEIAPASVLETLLRQGRVLLLLDGLDEVCDRDRHAVSQEIRRFSEKYFKNLFVATCRTTAKTSKLKGFRDVEIASFTPDQIAAFVLKWFTAFTQTNPQDEREKSVQFIAKLNLPENLKFRQLAATPLFLHLACCIFHRQEKFSSKRAEFYQQCLDLLLGKWDEAKGITRDEYQFLLPQKLRLLSQIAKETFEQGEYFFKQQVIERHIGNYIRDLANAPNQTEELQLDSKVVLKAMDLQHGLLVERARGIFSFSYAAFQEYFTAREIVASHNLHALEPALECLVNHITEPRWREIFLLTATMLQSADSLVQLMKQQIDALVAPDPSLQEFLTWARHTLVLTHPSMAATVVFDLALTPNLPVTPHPLTRTLDQGVFVDTALNKLVLECAIDSSSDFAYAYTLTNALSNALAIVMDVGLHQSLQQLKDQLPDPQQEQQKFQVWWQTNHLAWVERLRAAIALHRNIQYHWHFSPQQQQTLQRYYEANQLLSDCLNSNCEVTVAVRQEIEVALLLPQKKLEQRQWQRS